MKKAVLIVCVSIVAAAGLVVWFSPNFRADFPYNLKKTREVWFTPWRTSGLDSFYIKSNFAQVRNQPFGNSMVTIELLQNTEVRLEELDGDWARIVVKDGTRGWVRTNMLARRPVTPEAGSAAVPVRQPSARERPPSERGVSATTPETIPSAAPVQRAPARDDTSESHAAPAAPAPASEERLVVQPEEPTSSPSVPVVRPGQTGPLDIPPPVQRTVPVVTPTAATPAPAAAQPAKSTASAPAPKPVAEKPIVTPKPVVAAPKPADVAKEQPVQPVVSTPAAQPAPPQKKPAATAPQQPAQPKEIKCPRCGTTNVEGDRFCIYCREPLR